MKPREKPRRGKARKAPLVERVSRAVDPAIAIDRDRELARAELASGDAGMGHAGVAPATPSAPMRALGHRASRPVGEGTDGRLFAVWRDDPAMPGSPESHGWTGIPARSVRIQRNLGVEISDAYRDARITRSLEIEIADTRYDAQAVIDRVFPVVDGARQLGASPDMIAIAARYFAAIRACERDLTNRLPRSSPPIQRGGGSGVNPIRAERPDLPRKPIPDGL